MSRANVLHLEMDINRWSREWGKRADNLCTQELPHAFPASYQADYIKGLRLWQKKSNAYLEIRVCSSQKRSLCHHASFGVPFVNFKDMEGRGRKRALCPLDFYEYTPAEFERVKECVFKIIHSGLLSMDLFLIRRAGNESSYQKSVVVNRDLIQEKIANVWF